MTQQTQTSGPMPGDELGEFRILHLIGEGAMGKVYEARQLSLQRRVALKVLPGDVQGSDSTAVTRFYREARAAAQLHHPNIVPVYDFGVEQGQYYYAMQFVPGRSLHDLIHNEQQPLDDQRQVATWMLNVARGLDAAHALGVVHRDIKPANIMIREDNEAVITDFGLSRHQKRKSITQTGALMGTPVYMSPQQARGEKVDHSADIYAVGATLYECLTGQVPFMEKNLRNLLVAITCNPPQPPTEIRPTISPDLEAITLKALAKDPGERYQTAKELGDDLLRYLRGDVVQARAATGLQVALRRLERQPVVVGLIALNLVVLIAAYFIGSWKLRQEPLAKAGQALSDAKALVSEPLAAYEQATEQVVKARKARDARVHRRGQKGGDSGVPRALLALRSAEERLVGDRGAEGSPAERSLDLLRRVLALAPAGHARIAEAKALMRKLLQAQRVAAEHLGAAHLAALRRRQLSLLGSTTPDATPATLDVVTDPVGAKVTLRRVETDPKTQFWKLSAAQELGVSPLERKEVPAGELVLELSASGRVLVRVPLKVAAGESPQVRLELPSAEGVPQGFVYVAPGEFPAGGDPKAVRPLFHSPEPTWVGGFFLARHEVSVAEYLKFLRSRTPRVRGSFTPKVGGQFVLASETVEARASLLNHPVVGVGYENAREYCRWRSAKEGVTFRLPTNEEWEKAARGPAGRHFPWGDGFAAGQVNLHRAGSPANTTAARGSHARDQSIYGVFDMGGNLSEWVDARFGGSLYRVLRGGSWARGPEVVRSASREAVAPRAFPSVANRVGFRLAFD